MYVVPAFALRFSIARRPVNEYFVISKINLISNIKMLMSKPLSVSYPLSQEVPTFPDALKLNKYYEVI
jgi:hypothetical protein